MNDPHALLDIRHHDIVAPHYDELVNLPRRVLSDRIFARIGRFLPAAGARMLDLGAGTGHMTVRFGARFAEAVLVDHSEGMLAQARRNTAHLRTRVRIEQRDALVFIAATAERFDLIACAGFLHHLEPAAIARLLRNIRGALVDGGVAVLAEPVLTSRAEPDLVRRWNRPSLPKLERYRALAEAPDEAPLPLPVLLQAIEASGLDLVHERRSWELFARHQGNLVDRLAIPLIDWLCRDEGGVWFGVLRRSA